jgi:hypothetical protein
MFRRRRPLLRSVAAHMWRARGLHEDGSLNDAEFSAAKRKLPGI